MENSRTSLEAKTFKDIQKEASVQAEERVYIYMPKGPTPGIGKILLVGLIRPAACFCYSLRTKNGFSILKDFFKKEKIKICKRDRMCPDIYSQAFSEKVGQSLESRLIAMAFE